MPFASRNRTDNGGGRWGILVGILQQIVIFVLWTRQNGGIDADNNVEFVEHVERFLKPPIRKSKNENTL